MQLFSIISRQFYKQKNTQVKHKTELILTKTCQWKILSISGMIWLQDKKNLNCSLRVRFMVFYTNFNNISVLSWQSVLLVEETRLPGEYHWPATSHWQTLSHKVVSNTAGYEWDSQVQVVVNPTTIWSWPRLSLVILYEIMPSKVEVS